MEVGTKFVGKVNNRQFELVDIKSNSLNGTKYAIVKDSSTGKVFEYGMTALEHCEVEVIK